MPCACATRFRSLHPTDHILPFNSGSLQYFGILLFTVEWARQNVLYSTVWSRQCIFEHQIQHQKVSKYVWFLAAICTYFIVCIVGQQIKGQSHDFLKVNKYPFEHMLQYTYFHCKDILKILFAFILYVLLLYFLLIHHIFWKICTPYAQ